MKTFIVYMTSTVIEKIEVEAKTKEKAQKIAENDGEWNMHDSHVDGFEVEEKTQQKQKLTPCPHGVLDVKDCKICEEQN